MVSDLPRVPPDLAGAEQIRSWLDARISQIQYGGIAVARTALEAPGWRVDFDLTGISLPHLARIDEFVETAAVALANLNMEPDVALNALRNARAVVAEGP